MRLEFGPSARVHSNRAFIDWEPGGNGDPLVGHSVLMEEGAIEHQRWRHSLGSYLGSTGAADDSSACLLYTSDAADE